MRHLLTGIACLLLLFLNTLLVFVPVMLLGLLKRLPWRPWQHLCSRGLTGVAECWGTVNNWAFARLCPTRWDVRGAEHLKRNGSYLIICNHQSWVDIPALMQVFNRKIPYFRFFLKQELIWIPLLGLAFWALDYPFMKRHSSADLKKNPRLRTRDLEIARQACEKFRGQPVTVVNYLEGTRFTPAKKADQQSPYQHLLKPKTGGIAFVFGILGQQLDAVLDVTLVYPDGRVPGFWALLSGQVPRIIIDVQTRPLPPELRQDDFERNPGFRRAVQKWIGQIWQEKDERIDQLQHEAASR